MGVLRAWVAVLERISRLGVCEREANVRLDWRVAHCLQMLGSAKRKLFANEAAIVVKRLWCCNGSEFGAVQKLEVLRFAAADFIIADRGERHLERIRRLKASRQRDQY